jgi:Carboxypeptidase regulatory-like domain
VVHPLLPVAIEHDSMAWQGAIMRTHRFVIYVSITLIALGAMAISQTQVAAATVATPQVAPPGLTGVIRDSHGKPLNGVAVSARSSERTFTTSVYTDERGEYVFPQLTAGKYQLWAQAVTFTTERAELTLDGQHTINRNLTLKPLTNYESQLTGVTHCRRTRRIIDA